MNNQLSNLINNKKYSLLLAFLLIIVFAVSNTLTPLYVSNQNTYFLHGLDNSNFGVLSYDWLANTTDPFPLFSLLVSQTYSNAPTFFFHIYYIFILGVFICSIMGIASKVWEINRSHIEYFTYFVVITSLCSSAVGNLSQKLIGYNLSHLLEGGVAGQKILGSVFQPAIFGVFLLLSVYAFLRNRPFVAVLFSGVAATFHASDLLSAAALTLTYMIIIILEEKNYRKVFLLGLFSLLVVAPVVSYSYFSFFATSTSLDITSKAQNILVEYRFPHHAKVDVWFWSVDTLTKLSIILYSFLALKNKKKIFLIILIPFLISLFLTLIQVLTKSQFLALLFPWRISTFLVPLTSIILVGGAVDFIFRRYAHIINNYRKAIIISLLIALVFLFLSGLSISYFKNRIHNKKEFLPMMNFITATKTKDDIYLIPTNLGRFRLQTGARILVDKKSHPFKSVEVIEWYDRIQSANAFYNGNPESKCDVLQEISFQYGVTHIVYNNKKNSLNCNFLNKIFDDGKYSVFKIDISN